MYNMQIQLFFFFGSINENKTKFLDQFLVSNFMKKYAMEFN